MSLQLGFAALSDVGRVRRDNQDSGYAGPHLLAVADGVGGAVRGDVASSAAIDELRRIDSPPGNDALESIAGAIHRAHDRLLELVEQHPELDGTSTTVSAGIFDGTHLGIAHVGDSRGYLLREGDLTPLTTDHTLVQSLIEEGRITEDEARVHPHRNLILRAVDGVREPEPDLHSVELRAGDRLLFCSDGCSGSLTDDRLAAILGAGPLEEVAARLVSSALEAGSSDNVTVVVAELTEDTETTPTPVDRRPILVGAILDEPHLHLVSTDTGNLDAAELEGLEGYDDLDPEELRYAPRPPRRLGWLRRVAVLVVVLALVFLAGQWLYSLSQHRYFVSASGQQVAIYQGIPADLPLLDMNHVYETTTISVEALPSARKRQVQDGITANSLADARRIVANLRAFAVCEELATRPTPAPTLTPRKPASPQATTGATPAQPSATTAPRAKKTTPAPRPTSTSTPTDCPEAP